MGPEHGLLAAPPDPRFVLLLALAGAVTAVLAGLGLAAFVRRRSRSYLLIALALLALFVRTVVAVTAMLGLLSVDAHHLLEHGLDIVMAALVIGAVFYARSIESTQQTDGTLVDE